VRKAQTLGICLISLALACGGGDSDPCEPEAFAHGDAGHASPLGSSAGQARAGRLKVSDFPATPRGLETWKEGDFVIANDRIAMVIEDARDSELADPWGGRPIGFALMDGGAMTQPTEFGELFLLVGRFTMLTQKVSVLNDGSDGSAAIIRATGPLAPIPMLDPILSQLIQMDASGIDVAFDYILEPDSSQVQVAYHFRSSREDVVSVEPNLHAFMFTNRMDVFAPGRGFGAEGKPADVVILADDDATSIAYQAVDESLQGGIGVSGFVSNFVDPYEIASCGETQRAHASITLAGPGLQGVQKVLAAQNGTSMRTISGAVVDSLGTGQAGVRVHAVDTSGDYVTRGFTDADGNYSLDIEVGTEVELYAFRQGEHMVGPIAATSDSVELAFAPHGFIHVSASEVDGPENLPVRVQVLPTDQELITPPANFGEAVVMSGRMYVDYAITGDSTIRVSEGTWEVVVSRGYEYELHRETVVVGSEDTLEVTAALERSVDTSGVMCGDFHIHTLGSPDSGDDAHEKVMSAVADGLEIPVRSEHEYVDSFETEIDDLNLHSWAFPLGSIEMTSLEAWGHMGVFPLTNDPGRRNQGAPKWIDFPATAEPVREVELLSPVDVLSNLRQRPERPVVIINHPRSSGSDYFEYVGLDSVSGLVDNEADWDEEFRLVEIFNNSSWRSNRDDTVKDWLGLLGSGRRIFAIGSSDSHKISSTPVGYPRTCLAVGVDQTSSLSADLVRDTAFAGASTISGGVYINASVNGAGPGEDTTGSMVSIVVQAATWVDVNHLEVLVDGETVHSIALTEEHLDPENPVIRYSGELAISPATGGSHVIVVAEGDERLAPVHPGEEPFAVSNPIFVAAP